MRSSWETYENKKIFYAHYEYLTPDEHRVEIHQVVEEMLQQPNNSVLCLMNITGVPATPQVMNDVNGAASKSAKHIYKVALIGLGDSAYFKLLLNAVYRFSGMYIVPFNNEQQAKDWLVA